MRLFLAFVLALLSMSSTTALARPVEGVPCARAGATYARDELQGHNCVLLYAQQRWLDPSTGRFLSLDPVAGALDEPLSTQGYTYGRSNPLRFTDPDGRFDNPVADSLGYLERQLRMISEVSVDFLTSTTKGAAVGLAGLACTASVGCATVVGIIGTVGLMTSGAPTAVAMEDQGQVAWKCMHGTATYEELLQCGEMEGGAPAAMVGGAASIESKFASSTVGGNRLGSPKEFPIEALGPAVEGDVWHPPSMPSGTYARRSEGLGAESFMKDLLDTEMIPGSRGVIIKDKHVSFDDMWSLTEKHGLEFSLSREEIGGEARFVLRSGNQSEVLAAAPGARNRTIAHTHPSRIPRASSADIRQLEMEYMSKLDNNTNEPRPFARVIAGRLSEGMDVDGTPKAHQFYRTPN